MDGLRGSVSERGGGGIERVCDAVMLFCCEFWASQPSEDLLMSHSGAICLVFGVTILLSLFGLSAVLIWGYYCMHATIDKNTLALRMDYCRFLHRFLPGNFFLTPPGQTKEKNNEKEKVEPGPGVPNLF